MGKKRFVLFSSCLMFSFVLMLVVAALNGFAISHTDVASVHAPVNHLKSSAGVHHALAGSSVNRIFLERENRQHRLFIADRCIGEQMSEKP